MADQNIIQIDQKDLTGQTISNGAGATPATKLFAVNATGNLFVASTLNGGEGSSADLTTEAKTAFSQVSVFFSAMTKALAESGKSIYDHQAINAVIRQSGMFVQVAELDYKFKTSKWGVDLSAELIKVLMSGFSGNLAAIAKGLVPLISSAGAAGFSIASSGSQQKANVATLVFVCEYLLGAVSITPIMIVADMTQMAKTFQAGPCLKFNKEELNYNLKKYQYLFVPPEFMSQAVTINDAMANPDFAELVRNLRSSIDPDQSTDQQSDTPTEDPK
jgi:hypothetical protein